MYDLCMVLQNTLDDVCLSDVLFLTGFVSYRVITICYYFVLK
jgi:hypothetical protein